MHERISHFELDELSAGHSNCVHVPLGFHAFGAVAADDLDSTLSGAARVRRSATLEARSPCVFENCSRPSKRMSPALPAFTYAVAARDTRYVDGGSSPLPKK